MQTTANPGDILRGPALLFLITWIVHSGDHIRRGTATTPDGVIWAGTLVAILVTVGLTLIFTGHALAPATTAVVFPAVAVGVVATHFLPDGGSASRSWSPRQPLPLLRSRPDSRSSGPPSWVWPVGGSCGTAATASARSDLPRWNSIDERSAHRLRARR